MFQAEECKRQMFPILIICFMHDCLWMMDELDEVIACFLKNQPWFTLMAY